MGSDPDNWYLVRAQKDKESFAEDESYEDFSPTFTYPVCTLHCWLIDRFSWPLLICSRGYPSVLQIFGEDEKIYGYNDLVIDVSCRRLGICL